MLITNGEPDTRRRVSPVLREGVGNLLFDIQEQGAFSLPYYLLDSVLASTMLSNSEYIVMLNQAASDRQKLADLLNISNEQMSYITNADAGCGLIKYGSSLVPFINKFPKNTRLYRLMTTKPGEDSANRSR